MDEVFDPGRLEFGQTYFWRVDEVNGAPDNAIFKGQVWRFEVEPSTYPITNIQVTASSADGAAVPENTVNGSGLTEDGLHSVDAPDMWLSGGGGPQPVWLQYEFDRVYKLHEMWVWNYNIAFEKVLGFGLKSVTVEHSSDGVEWSTLGDVEFAQAPAVGDYAHNTTVDFGGAAARHVRLTVNSNYGGLPQSGLSEVRFLSIPTQARNPEPASGATEVTVDPVLTWRPGREAAVHEVYISTDMDAVVSETGPVDTVLEPQHALTSLALGLTYYWKVNEVNDTESNASWTGDVWDFTTQEYMVVDDIESYDDDEDRIFDTWLDGFVNETGSTVGYFESPFAERSIVHGGRQSMPLAYNNADPPYYSEAERTWTAAQNWALGGADTLVLYVRGAADNEPEPLYVVVEDNGGRSMVVRHPDPEVALATEWQVWRIPYSTFSEAAMQFTSIKRMVIGLGDPDNPTAGGSGLVFIDDIFAGHPAD
jgi:hypothetical protein